MRKSLVTYGLTLAAVVAAVLLRWLLDPLMGDTLPLVTLFGGVAFAVWLGGYRPALLGAVLGYLACDYLFIEPRGSFGFADARNLVGLVAYLVTCSIIIGFGEAMRVAQRRFEELVRQQGRAAEVLAEQKERLRTTLASIGDAVISTDTGGRITNMNAVAESLTGWKTEEALGQPLDTVFQIVNEKTRQPVHNPATKAIKKGVVVGLANHTVLIAKGGTERPIDDSAAPIRCEKGEVVGCVLVFRDVTERREAERAARSLASIVESSDDAIIGKDVEGVITSWNRAAEQLFGYSATEAIGRPIAILAPPDRADEMPAILARLKQGGHVKHFDTVRRAKDGRLVPISLTASPIKDEDGEIVGASKIARDISERKRAEERLHEERERLRVTLASIGDAVITTDVEGCIAYLNAVAESLTGWTQGEAVGQPLDAVFRIVNEQTREGVDNPAKRALKEGVVVGLANHTVLIRKDGTERPIDDSASPIRDGQGHVIGCVLVFRDITERRKTEVEVQRLNEELRDRLDEWQTVLDMVPVGIGIAHDPECRRITHNPYISELLGVPAWENASLSAPEGERPATYAIHRDGKDLSPELLPMQLACTGVEVREFECDLVRQGQPPVRLVCSARPLLDAEGRIRGGVGVTLDITARKQAEDDLRLAEERTRSVVNNVLDGIISIDESGMVQFFNPAAERLFGYSAYEVIGQNVRMLMPEPFHSEHDGYLANYRRTGQAKIIGIGREVEGRRKDGSIFPMDLAVSEFWLGKRRYFTGLVRDITERKRAEKQVYGLLIELKDADRRKDEFLATLAHELRGPLAPLGNMLEIMKRADGNGDLLEKARSTMERQLGQLVRLVDDLIDVSRITRNKIELRKERVELASIIHQSVEACRPLAECASLEVNVALPPQPIYTHADPARLAQVFSNLLNNACKYTEPGGKIWLTAERQGSYVVVKVKDTGLGIPPDKLGSVFEMFTQINRTLERSQGGLGIGLTLVKRLVEMHDGTVTAHSEGVGKGSEFVVRLPILIEQPKHEGRRPATVTAAPPRRILVVDDNVDAASSLAMLLKMTGNETQAAHDGLEALEATERFRPDVVLLDIGLPKLNGYEVCRRIREQPWGKNIVMVALTGWGQEEDRRKSTEAGFNAHMVKPVDYAALTALLAERRPAGA